MGMGKGMGTGGAYGKGGGYGARHQEGYVEKARSVGRKGAMAKGATRVMGKTSTTLENGVSSTASKIGNGFMPKPKGK